MDTPEKLRRLRTRLREEGLHAFLVPSSDPHQDEYVPPCWQRRAWLSGFDGSAGDLVVTRDGAALWTDGRYHLQAQAQLAGSGIELMRQGEPGVPGQGAWLAQQLKKGQVVGVDPRTLSPAAGDKLAGELGGAGLELRPLDPNPVDAVWEQRPALPAAPVSNLPVRFTGAGRATKLRRVRGAMAGEGCDALVMAALDGIAWLLNLRGEDIPFNPVFLAYFVVEPKAATLYVDDSRLPAGLRKQLASSVRLRPYTDVGEGLRRLAAQRKRRRVWLDQEGATMWLREQLDGADLHLAPGPVGRMKAAKNATELAGMRECHVRDGVAMVRFLSWLEGAVREGPLTEITAADELERLRAQGEHFRGLSFPTISGHAANGAVIHYKPEAATARRLEPKGLYLVDSGAQYLDGTTDITRTVLLGDRATRTQREHFTRVLRGHIALARASFPAGTSGKALDSFARGPLWEAGLDYRHGTGHGVGHHLNVHEGPQAIGPRDTGVALEPGNVLSNEPGYYRAGHYGIRIENLVEVVERAPNFSPDGGKWLGFEELTLCPLDMRLVEPKLLADAERQWLDRYHRRVRKELSPRLDAPARRWLARACKPVPRPLAKPAR